MDSSFRQLWSSVLLALGGVAAGVAAALVVLTSDRADQKAALIAIALPVGWAFIGSGVLVRLRSPENRVGPLMIATGFVWFLRALPQSDSPTLFTIGLTTSALAYPMIVHLLLIYPDGRFRTRSEKLFQTIGYASIVAIAVSSLFWRWPNDRCSDCPENRLLVLDRPGLGRTLYAVGLVLALIALTAAGIFLVGRWRSEGARGRRALKPVLAAGGLIVVAIVTLVLTTFISDRASYGPFFVVSASFVAVPIALFVGFVRSRLAPAAVGPLLAELGESPTAGETEAAFGRVLGDPSLRLAYWLPAAGAYVDVEGRRFELPEAADGRSVALVEYRGEPVAALVYDESLRHEPELVDAVAAAARVTLHRYRLEAELKAKVEELRASRARIVEAGDAERRRLERNLHDGAQQRLVTLALTLKLAEREAAANPERAAETLRRAHEELAQALAELRELARGLHPAVVADRGLPAAIDGLSARMPLPVDVNVELTGRPSLGAEVAAYYVVAEALANVVKYASASSVRVDVCREGGDVLVAVADDGVGGAAPAPGSGLGGLVDRVETLGGSLAIESPLGSGTTLRARIPAG